MELPWELLWALFAAINGASFLVVLHDKARSRSKGQERISEGVLFFLAVMFGAAGVWAGMLVSRHKTRKWYFVLGVPMALAQNLAALWWIQAAVSW